MRSQGDELALAIVTHLCTMCAVTIARATCVRIVVRAPSHTGAAGLQVSSDESERLIKMEETLHNRVIGQEEAVVAIARAIRRARVGLKSPNRPIASFIFSGKRQSSRSYARVARF